MSERLLIKRSLPSRSPEWFVQWVVLPVAWLTFFGSVWLAAHLFPGEYDWRYMTISLLLSVKENPHAYWIVGLGISISGLIQIPLPGFFYGNLRGISPWGAGLGWFLMVLGLTAMILIGIIPKHPSFFPKAHDVLAMVAFVSPVLSVIVNTALLVRRELSYVSSRESSGLWSWISLTSLALIPMLGTGLTQLYLYCFARGLSQKPLAWGNQGIPFVFSLAFWEWVTCVFLILYLMLLVRLTYRLKRKTLDNPF